MDGQYGLLFLLALKGRAPRDRSTKAEDAYYARFSETPLRRLARLMRPCPSADERSGASRQEPSCTQPRSPAVKGTAAETETETRAVPSRPMACKTA